MSDRSPQKTTRIRMGGSPAFIIPKSNQTVQLLTYLREVNKRIILIHFPLPKSSSIFQELEGFTYATKIYLNMGHYIIRFGPDANKICTFILPWDKYSYLCLHMGISGTPDIFQEETSNLMHSLEYVRRYIDDLLVIKICTYWAGHNK